MLSEDVGLAFDECTQAWHIGGRASRMVIQEILRRLEQGVTRPFLCRGDDGALYVVKGRGGRDTLTLCREWLAGQLARKLKLPIPYFTIADVPPALVENSAVPEIEVLGSGAAFASRWVVDAEELAVSHLPRVQPDLKPRILFFDRWIQNGDRTLSEAGGNPNLLWTPRTLALHVIDHNNAFDDQFDVETFRHGHVFRASSSLWNDAFQAELSPLLTGALDDLDSFWGELPESWLWSDSFASVPTDIDLTVVRSMLEQPQTNSADFWRTEP